MDEPREVSYLWTPDWMQSPLHAWLNGDFLDHAFSVEERERMADGAGTGRLFVLSEEEYERFFPKEKGRAWETDWWLRDTGLFTTVACKTPEVQGLFVQRNGETRGEDAGDEHSVCPGMWISRYCREERMARISEAEAVLKEERNAQIARHAALLGNLSEEERNRLAELKTARADAEADAEKLEKILLDCQKKYREQKGILNLLKCAEKYGTSSLKKLSLFQFHQRKELKASIEKCRQKIREGAPLRNELRQKEKAAADDFSRAMEAVSMAKKAHDNFFRTLEDGEQLAQIDQWLENSPADLNALRREYGITPS